MSCCPKAPAVIVGAIGEFPTGIAENQMMPGESTECYMATAQNPTGKHDDATENVDNKIENSTIPLDKDGNVKNVVFRLQAGSSKTPTEWTFEVLTSDGSAPLSLLTNDFSPSDKKAAQVTFNHTFAQADFGKTFKLLVTAKDADGEIDSRSFVFSPAKASASNSIALKHPLPGSVVTSRFNPQRKHPVTGVIKPHFGCDMAYGGGVTKEVLAAADGEVIFTGFQAGGAGNYVKIKHYTGAGVFICMTVYMHLKEIYVSSGQKVSAGQKIGFEGNTGIGTGAHLHFELHLPNDTKIDPEPYLTGTVQVAQSTNSDNTAASGSIQSQQGVGVLTSENVKAKTAGCNPYGAEYPTSKSTPSTQTPPSTNDPFELAWQLTLTTEVIGWKIASPPSDPDILDGKIDDPSQRRKCGYVNHPADPGGETKFGVAQRFNKSISVKSCTYDQARSIAYNNFWAGKLPDTIKSTKKKSAVAIFNFGYLCGPGGASYIYNQSGAASISDDAQALEAICNKAREYLTQKTVESPSKKVFLNGWMARVEKVRAYCKAITA
jgi:murein DD-endopeptidase MepM/ murein hydrolase activator NlpD